MRDLFPHRGRTLAAALTLVAAVLALVLVVPMASAENPGGKNEVRFYVNEKGDKTKKVGEDELFGIVGKNLNHTVEVFCRQNGNAGGITPPPANVKGGPWDDVTDWSYDPNGSSKLLVDVDMDPDCGGGRSAILVEFDNKTPGDTSDDIYVKGPEIQVKAPN